MKTIFFRGASAAVLAILASSIATSSAQAQSSAPSDQNVTTLSDLVVVAQKRAERLETVPVAISAYTSEQRDLVGIKSVQDLTDYTPGLSYTSFDNRPYLRGVGRQSDNLAVDSGVAVYVDGVFNGANASTILQNDSLFVDRIEVLRGPQTTLYGRNADGGAINYVSKRPTNQFEAEVRAGAANYDKYFIEGAVSGPITDSLRFRLGANYTSQTGGYYKNLNGSPEGGSVAQGGNGTSYHIEGQLEGNIGDKFDWWAKVATNDYNVTYHTETLVGPLDTREFYNPLMPNQNFGLCGLPSGAGGLGCAGAPDKIVSVTTLPNTIGTNPSALDIRTFDADFKSRAKQGQDVIFATNMTYHFPSVDVKYLFGYQKFYYNLLAPWLNSQGVSSSVQSYTLKGPTAATPLCSAIYNNAGCTGNLTINPAHTSFSFIENERFYSHELDFSSTYDGPVQWIAGLYYYREHYDQPINVLDPSQAQVKTPLLLTFAPAAANPTGSVYNEDTVLNDESIAAFGQVDWKINDQFKLTAGARYSDDHKYGVEQFRQVLFNLEEFGLGVNTFGSNAPAFDATSCPTTGPYPGAGACTINAATGKAVRTLDARWHAWTGELNLAWTPDAETLGYVKYSRGYKEGAFNSGTMAAFPEAKPETVDAFEAGLKKTYGGIFQANVSTFYYNYENEQQPLGTQPPNGPITTLLFNIPKAESYGLEFEGLWQPISNLTLSLNYAYLVSKVTSTGGHCFEDTADPMALEAGANTTGCPAAVGGVQLQNLNHQTLSEAPRNKVSLNGLYKWSFEPGTLTLSGTYVWKDKTYDSPFNRAYNLSPSYSQVNVRATWTDKDNRYSAIVFADNLFDSKGYDGVAGLLVTNPGPGQVVDRLESLTAPRTFGIELQYRFK